MASCCSCVLSAHSFRGSARPWLPTRRVLLLLGRRGCLATEACLETATQVLHLSLPRHKDQNAAFRQLPVYLAHLRAWEDLLQPWTLPTSTMVPGSSLAGLQRISSAMTPQADAEHQGGHGRRQGQRFCSDCRAVNVRTTKLAADLAEGSSQVVVQLGTAVEVDGDRVLPSRHLQQALAFMHCVHPCRDLLAVQVAPHAAITGAMHA